MLIIIFIINENQIEIVNENKDMKNDKNIKDINDKKLIIKRI